MRVLAGGVPLAILVVGVVMAFQKPLLGMVHLWSASPMYSYAFTVPFVSAGLAWSRRDSLANLLPRPARLAATPLLIAALLALVVGEMAGVQIIQQLAFVAVIPALVLFLAGFDVLKLSAPAIGYLMFMVPFWEVLTERLHAPFQENSAEIGVALMHAVGVPAYRDATIIALPNVILEVARECSGVNYLIAVLALALPLAFLRLRSWTRRIVLVGAAVTIAALANGVRVGLIGWLAYLEIGSPLHGPFHVLHGLFVAGIGYVVLFAGLAWMETREPLSTQPHPLPTARLTWPSRRDALCLAAVFWLLAAGGLAPSSSPVALTSSSDQVLPITLDTWNAEPDGTTVQATPAAATWADADVHLVRRYRRGDTTRATVDVWYYSQQTQQREVINFRVADLHRRAVKRHIPLIGGGSLPVNAIAWPDLNQTGLFWYELANAPESSEYRAKIRSVWSSLISRQSNAAAVMLTMAAPEGQAPAGSQALDDLATRIHLRLAQQMSGSNQMVGGGR